MALRHTFVSAFPDGPDATKLRPSDWNAAHEFDGGAHGSVLVRDTGETDGVAWVASEAGVLASAGADQTPEFRALTSGDIPALDYVPTSRTVNGHALSSNVTITADDLVPGVATGSMLVSNGVGADPVYQTNPIALAAWGVTFAAAEVSVVNDGVLFLGASPVGMLMVSVGTDNNVLQYALVGAGNGTQAWHDVFSQGSNAKDTASKINIYYDASGPSGAGYYLQNKRGGSRNVRLTLIGG